MSNWGVYLPAFRNRQLLGLPPVEVPQEAAPPEAVTAIEEVASGDERTFTFRVHHGVNPAGHMVLAKLTRAMPSVAQKPTSHVARIICGHNTSSLVLLPATGGTVSFPNARFAVREGERYGVELRIVRVADGIHSRPFFADLIRKGAQEQRAGATDGGGVAEPGKTGMRGSGPFKVNCRARQSSGFLSFEGPVPLGPVPLGPPSPPVVNRSTGGRQAHCMPISGSCRGVGRKSGFTAGEEGWASATLRSSGRNNHQPMGSVRLEQPFLTCAVFISCGATGHVV